MYLIFQRLWLESYAWFVPTLGWWSVLTELRGWRSLGVLSLLAIVLASLIGLLAIWGGLGRGNWFLRATPVMVFISLLLTIPAFELVFVYLIQAGLTVVALVVWRKWRLSRREPASELNTQASPLSPWQFSIRDLMLLTVLTAWVSAMLAEAPRETLTSASLGMWAQWRGLLVEGIIAGGLTIAAAWIALGKSRWWTRLLAFVLLFPSALMVIWLVLWRWSRTASTTSGRRAGVLPSRDWGLW